MFYELARCSYDVGCIYNENESHDECAFASDEFDLILYRLCLLLFKMLIIGF